MSEYKLSPKYERIGHRYKFTCIYEREERTFYVVPITFNYVANSSSVMFRRKWVEWLMFSAKVTNTSKQFIILTEDKKEGVEVDNKTIMGLIPDTRLYTELIFLIV